MAASSTAIDGDSIKPGLGVRNAPEPFYVHQYEYYHL